MKFEFHIEGLSRENADRLLNIIIAFVEALGLEVGGGFVEDTEGGDVEEAA